jgi:hypothetical protein
MGRHANVRIFIGTVWQQNTRALRYDAALQLIAIPATCDEMSPNPGRVNRSISS